MRREMNFLLLAFTPLSVLTFDTDFNQLSSEVPLTTEIPISPKSVRPDTLTSFGIPYHMWHCGSGEFITNQVILAINKTCPAAAADFNHCCAVHDDCYSNKRGRAHCDKEFCGCLSYFTENSEEGAPCGDMSKYACSMVASFGGAAYNADPKDADSSEEPYVPKQIPRIKKNYQNLYKKCATQKVTLGSCALNFDICHTSPNSIQKPACVLNLLRCLDDTRNDRNPDRECDFAVEQTLWKFVDQKVTEEPNLGTFSGEVGSESVTVGSEGGDVNILMMQGIMQNQTFVKKIYLQIVKTTTSLHWLVYFCFFVSIFLCCTILMVALSRNTDDDDRRRGHQDEVINVRVTSTDSGVGGKRTSSSSSQCEAPKSPSSSVCSSSSSIKK